MGALPRDAGLGNTMRTMQQELLLMQGRPTGFVGNTDLFKKVASTPISQGGGLFLDRSRLNVFEGQYNFPMILILHKTEQSVDRCKLKTIRIELTGYFVC
jgi:hypothetical protein